MDDTAQAAAPPDFISRLAAIKPRTREEYRAHVLNAEIFPTVKRWGFEDRFHVETLDFHPDQRTVFDACRRHMNGRGSIVALVGPRGVGKTTVAAQLAIEQAWTNHEEAIKQFGPRRISHFIYRKCAKIVARYKPIFADFGTVETDRLLDSLDMLCRQQEFLVIDEVHECDDMKFKRLVLTDLIDRRYSCCRDTFLIANQTGEEFAATIGDSILSRLGEHGAILECNWPSFRTQ